jgi:nucleotide-binding universal stress UspA family protein
MPKQNILIPLDGSAFSRQILPYVQKFFNPGDVKLTLLRVGKEPAGMVGAPARPAAIESGVEMYPSSQDAAHATHPIYASQEVESAIANFEAEVNGDLANLRSAGYDVELDVCFGDPAEEIINYADLKDVDLIAMTTHGRTGMSRVLFGSVAQKVVHRATKPILIYRPTE